MIRSLLVLVGALVLTSCSSVGVHDLQKHKPRITQAPSRILVEPFSAPLSVFSLGGRSDADKRVLRDEIVAALAEGTAGELRVHAADAAVVQAGSPIPTGVWLIRGEIRRVDQGSRALRATVGLGAGRTEMRTRVTVYNVTAGGSVPILRFKTTGSSGLEPGVALGIATGGVGTALAVGSAAGTMLINSLPGVSSDIDRTSYEIAAVLSAYLQRNGLLDDSRTPVSPKMKGSMPSSVNLGRAVPAPLRGEN